MSRKAKQYTTTSPIERWIKKQGKVVWQLLVFVPLALVMRYYMPKDAQPQAATIVIIAVLAIITGKWFDK